MTKGTSHNIAFKKTSFATALILSFGLCALAFAHSGATGIVKDRMDRFSQSKDNLKAIKTYLAAGDLAAVISPAKEISDWAQQMPDYFPAGSNAKPSEASPEIWADFSGFERAAATHYQAANELVLAAQSGDAAATRNAFKATAATCKSCHKSYRLD
jgi:cytochrome c556